MNTYPSPFDHPFGTVLDRDALAERLTAAAGWEAKNRLLVQLARELPALPDAYRDDEHRVAGCESTAWLVIDRQAGRLLLAADSDSRIVKGLLALLLTAYHGRTPAELAGFDFEQWLVTLGLQRFLTASRGNGLRAMARMIHAAIAEFSH
ncbi:SufE family protein [Jeongeupia chitinilytica]|uniref:Cysteine desulfurase, sulfur acceptor subunit CsdE n=1 Tax=Jeongeupia chitinilytica TaxID=1041641 RepID=A0ABQ3GZV2_9NEIS|nr:SufE family protein [Jeongeupia chitinilytica]GHD59416.1 cysteine desulfurase, sulfur acceptor subunit CsdE [Jeongeupia chitinilytica]